MSLNSTINGNILIRGKNDINPAFSGHLIIFVTSKQGESCSGIFTLVLIDFLLTVKAATLIFISGRGLAISSAKEGKSGFIYDLVKS